MKLALTVFIVTIISVTTAFTQYTLTINDVTFNTATGEIEAYTNTTEKDIIIPETLSGVDVISIGRDAFRLKSLTAVILPNKLLTIGREAFSRNSLTSITIPDLVTEIEYGAFSQNDIASLTLGSSVATIGSHSFWKMN